MADAGKPTDWITMKIDPEIFEELGVRDPEETKREMAITKKTRQITKELKADPDNLDLQIELATLMIDGANYEEAIKQLLTIRNKRPKDSKIFEFPDTCPECQSKAVKFESSGTIGSIWRCPNTDCPAQVRGRLEHWCSRKAMDIEGGGTVLIDQLVAKGLALDVSELYHLKQEEIASLDRMGNKSAKKFMEGLAGSKSRDLWRVLFGLGILHVGSGVAKALAREYPSMHELMHCDVGNLVALEDVGETIARSVVDWFTDARNHHLIHRLEIVGRILRGGVGEILQHSITDRQFPLSLGKPHGGGGEALGE